MIQLKQLLNEFEMRVGNLVGRKITVIVHNPLAPSEENFYMITTAVCGVYNVSVDDVFKKTRIRHVSDARHLSMFIIRQRSKATLKEVGDFFNRDHTSIIHACDKIQDLIHIKDEATLFAIDKTNEVLNEA